MEVLVLADTGALMLCIPEHVVAQLQLEQETLREVTVADQGRSCFVGALVLGDSVWLGAVSSTDSDGLGMVQINAFTVEKVDPVPGPLPLAGAAAAFSWSRGPRGRIRRTSRVCVQGLGLRTHRLPGPCPQPAQTSASSITSPENAGAPSRLVAASILRGSGSGLGSTRGPHTSTARSWGMSSHPSRAPLR